MNFLKKGPELKLSEIRVPGFVQDVYYDLKDRHLLPIAAILLVAIVAVPIAISQSSGSEEAAPPAIAEPGAVQSNAGGGSGQLVAKSAPGLRDYTRRLQHRGSRDPFEPKQTGTAQSSGSGTSDGGSESTSSGGSTESPSTTTDMPSFEPSDEGNGAPGELTYYSYAIDVRISGGSEGKKATVRRNLPELTMLPSRETPAIVYMGSTRDGKKAVMTVSSDVESIFGDAKCALGSERCQLLVMEPGLPVTFVYGGSGRTYKIELLKIHLVETDKLNRAPLGKPKKDEDEDPDGRKSSKLGQSRVR